MEDEAPAPAPKVARTEVFESFELPEERAEKEVKAKKEKWQPSFQPQPRAPAFDFMDELMEKLEQRQKEIENEEGDQKVVYKAFDPKANKFKEISKEERDVKDKQLQASIRKIERQEERKQMEIERIQKQVNSMGGAARRGNPLFQEMQENGATGSLLGGLQGLVKEQEFSEDEII